MNKKFCILLFLISSMSIPAQEKKTELLAVAISVVGDVVSIRASKPQKVIKNFVFLTGDEVVAKKGSVDIQIGPGSIIRVANYTSIKITKILETNAKEDVKINLGNGKVFSKVSKKMPPGSSFEVSSPTITAGVRGTEFLISDENTENVKEPEMSDGVFVKEGEVAVKASDTNSVKDFTIKAGEEVISTSNGMKKQLLEEYVKEKMKILDTLNVMKESNYKLLKEQKEKNKALIGK